MKFWAGFLSLLIVIFGAGSLPVKLVSAKRGCCSWHGGVCGCSGGRQLCCDGTLSPSCTCYSPPASTSTPLPRPTATPTIHPTPTKKPSPTFTPTPILTPVEKPTETPSPTPTLKVLGEQTKDTTGGSEWLAPIFLLPVAMASFLIIKGRMKAKSKNLAENSSTTLGQ